VDRASRLQLFQTRDDWVPTLTPTLVHESAAERFLRRVLVVRAA